MDELIARAMDGVEPGSPGASWRLLSNLVAIMPWGSLLAWSVFFVVVGGLIGWWRGRTMVGIVAALLLGPFGWIVPLLARREPPPLPGRRPPPLPGSKNPDAPSC